MVTTIPPIAMLLFLLLFLIFVWLNLIWLSLSLWKNKFYNRQQNWIIIFSLGHIYIYHTSNNTVGTPSLLSSVAAEVAAAIQFNSFYFYFILILIVAVVAIVWMCVCVCVCKLSNFSIFARKHFVDRFNCK